MAKMTQQQANYRMGSPLTKCGNCLYYNIGNRDYQFGRCTKVAGSISTYGNCDLYQRILYPFPTALTNDEMQQLEQWYWDRVQEKGIDPYSGYVNVATRARA